jgi:hypothetical protein
MNRNQLPSPARALQTSLSGGNKSSTTTEIYIHVFKKVTLKISNLFEEF